MTQATNLQTDESAAFDLDDIFNKTVSNDVIDDKDAANANKEQAEKPIPVKEKPVKKDDSVKVIKKANDDDDDEEDEDSNPKDASKANQLDYKAEYEKQLKIVKDTQKSFHESNKKLAAYKKAVEKLKEDGSLLDEEAMILLDHAKYDNVPEEAPLIVRYANIWDKEFEYMRKYSRDPEELDQLKDAFVHLMQTASQQEINDILSDLSQYEDDEVEFTRQMLEKGREYNDDIYADIRDAGSIRNLKSKYNERIEELEKKLDKSEKKLNKYKEKYEDYDARPANMNLPTGSGSHSPQTTWSDLGDIFK